MLYFILGNCYNILMSYAIISALALLGFIIAAYIQHHKHMKRTLVCPMRAQCHNVIHSDYSKFLSVPVEVLGMLYYFSVFLMYLLFAVFPGLSGGEFAYVLLAVSAGAVVFSIYLLFVQAFVLKEWCSWCIASAIISTAIFLVSLSVYGILPEFLL